MKRIYLDYVLDIIHEIDIIKKATSDIEREAFDDDEIIQRAVVACLINIGEATKLIPEEVKARFPDIPWKNLSGMRDKLVHHYFGIDLDIVWTVAATEAPKLQEQVRKILMTVESDTD